jgi:hypothetical protein
MTSGFRDKPGMTGQARDGMTGTQRVRRRFIIAAALLAVVSIVIFLITQDMRLPVVLIDKWTILSAILLAAEITCVRLGLPKVKEHGEEVPA